MVAVMELPNAAEAGRRMTLGALSAMAARLVALRDSSCSPVTAVMAMGVSCSFC